MQRRGEFSFPGSPLRVQQLPPRPPPAGSATAPRYAAAAEEEEVRWLQASRQASPDYSSGTPSPQLWAYQHHNPDRHHQHQHHRLYPASAGSSPSRAQAIAGYRREMLDLVRGLPESAYELSLRDIVEHPATASSSPSSSPPPTHHDPLPPPSNAAAAREHRTDTDTIATATATQGSDESAAVAAAAVEDSKKQGRKQRTMRKQRSRSMERSVSLDTGLLIKLFLPLSMGGKKKKVSPRPDAAKDGKKEKKKQGKKKAAPATAPAQEEWWSKGEFSEAGSSSRTSSTGSSNSSAGSIRNGQVNGSNVNPRPRAPARSWSRKRTGCYAFFRANKGKNGASQD